MTRACSSTRLCSHPWIVLICLLSAVFVLSVGAASNYPTVIMFPMDPTTNYPDAQEMADLSGTVTAVFRAQGHYTFRSNYNAENDLIQHVKLNMSLSVRYIRLGDSEIITTTVQGEKVTTEEAPSRGINPEKFQYSCGYSYSPPLHIVQRETYSGTSVRRYENQAIKTLVWSKTQKLAAFQANLGDQPSGWPSNMIGIPVNVHVVRDVANDGEHERETSDYETTLTAILPSYGTSGSGWSQKIRQDQTTLSSMTSWIETASAQGTTNGSFQKPMSFRETGWVPEAMYLQSGKDPHQDPESEEDIIWPGHLMVTWALGAKMPQGEMSIVPADKDEYQQWCPLPIDDERYGNATSISFTARIKPKEKDKPAPTGRIHFWLTDVSREKGDCTNYPLHGDNEADLRFAQNQPGIIVDPGNPRHAYTEKPCSEATVDIEAIDTGAYGQLQATCDDLGLIAEDERTKRQVISIPIDDNHNHASDAWERSNGVYRDDLPWDDDDDQPSGQRRNGDGYSFYEEYRGFMTGKGFVRTHPKKKDLFVYDPNGLVEQRYEPYNPARLQLHYIGPDMMRFNGEGQNPDNRWVNFNSSEDKWYARQYAMYVVLWTTMDKDGGHASGDSLNNTSDDPYWGFDEPLKRTYVVKIAPTGLANVVSGIEDPALRNAVYEKLFTSTVIHEIGHCLGIHHHKVGEMEDDESRAGGIVQCAMRYTSKAEYNNPATIPLQASYCREGETWMDGRNSMPAHNCFGQIDVKSDP